MMASPRGPSAIPAASLSPGSFLRIFFTWDQRRSFLGSLASTSMASRRSIFNEGPIQSWLPGTDEASSQAHGAKLPPAKGAPAESFFTEVGEFRRRTPCDETSAA